VKTNILGNSSGTTICVSFCYYVRSTAKVENSHQQKHKPTFTKHTKDTIVHRILFKIKWKSNTKPVLNLSSTTWSIQSHTKFTLFNTKKKKLNLFKQHKKIKINSTHTEQKIMATNLKKKQNKNQWKLNWQRRSPQYRTSLTLN
jgi:hypothetical protein